MRHITPIDRHDPHFVPRKSEEGKAATFLAIGIYAIVLAGYIGYLIGRG